MNEVIVRRSSSRGRRSQIPLSQAAKWRRATEEQPPDWPELAQICTDRSLTLRQIEGRGALGAKRTHYIIVYVEKTIALSMIWKKIGIVRSVICYFTRIIDRGLSV